MTHQVRFYNRHPAILLCGIGMLAVAPLIFSTGIGSIASFTDTCLHLIRFCLATLAEFDFLLHGLPLALIGFGLAGASVRRISSVRRGAGMIQRIPTCEPTRTQAVGRLAERYKLQDRVTVMLGSPRAPAFTAGLLRPRIYIFEGLERVLSEAELEAVFLHERHHVRNYDPLRGVAARLVADAFFWIPMVRNVLTDFVTRIEFAADDAGRVVGDVVLASAILKVAEFTTADIAAASGFVSHPLVQQRVERLLDGDRAEVINAPKPRVIALSFIALAVIWTLSIASSAAHASHLPDSSGHCPHHHEMGVLHAAQTPPGTNR